MEWETGGDGAETAEPRSSLVDGAERAVRRWLAPGRFRPGDRLPPEQELAGMLRISRGTLRTALQRLEESGEIVRRQGSGTFVGGMGRGPSPRRTLRASSYNMHYLDELTTVEVLIELRPVDDVAASALEVDRQMPTTSITRTLVGQDGRVAVICHDIIHPDVVLPDSDSLRARLSETEIFNVLWSSETPPAVSHTRFTSIMLSPDEPLGQRFQITEPAAGMVIHEVLRGNHDEPLIYSWDVAMPGKVEVEVLRSTGVTGLEPLAGRDDEIPAAGPRSSGGR